MPVQSNEKAKSELRLRKKDHWENVRRNEDYLEKYRTYKSLLKSRGRDRSSRTRAMALGLEITEQFQLVEPIDPSLEFSDSIAQRIQIGEAFICFPTSRCAFPLLHPAKVSSFIVSDENQGLSNRVGAGRAYSPRRRKGKRSELLFDGKYLAILIDVDLPLKHVKAVASEAVKAAKLGLEDEMPSGGGGEIRKHFESKDDARKIYDLKRSGKTFSQITKELYRIDNRSPRWDPLLDKVKENYRVAKSAIESVSRKNKG